jgi:hypothetical protein
MCFAESIVLPLPQQRASLRILSGIPGGWPWKYPKCRSNRGGRLPPVQFKADESRSDAKSEQAASDDSHTSNDPVFASLNQRAAAINP